ncbi:hypothetical protein FKV75_01005 [Weissella paramesenteroides]|uniref:hypothetical protein n=1 Tax=Weissella paramesenteroides TaxID=1249 RepID=UPI00123A32D7|nr:hypothetical protein [Weissella paramesenteroides]KAA8442514.1 hypothetical protein FKV77_04670 [Weissella paramesenteroides]KAA8442861.1 hypothetical protein FKV81_00660 [Weissella paramesenteroides]KAA8444464.1 hypothetical protein FKV75_01005 [Weissella paramesenteroides]KAA8448131.1 hypothetical protein FKV76_02570 [Weissella paramesenteroides]KAA8452057.1 hypothetical protein FKV74_00660 [Weissella paramesenteroides]
MENHVKIIIDKLDASEINKIKQYVLNLRQLIGSNLSLTILDPRYKGDYNQLINIYEQLAVDFPDVQIDSFYVSQYLKSERRDNVNQFTTDYIGDQKFTVEKKDGQRLFMQNGEARIAIITNQAGKVTAVDFAKPGQKRPHQRVSVNSSGNIQVLRHFDEKTHLPALDEYVDTDLNTFMLVHFDERGLRADYQLVGWDEPVVYSKVDLYEQWFNRVIQPDDYVISLNRHYDVLFEDKHDVTKVFLM